MAYEVVMSYHLHMPSYFLGTFTEYPFLYGLKKKTLNLHLTYFVETLYSASPQTNKKALIPLRIRAFPNFAFLRSGAYGTRTRDPMRDRHVF